MNDWHMNYDDNVGAALLAFVVGCQRVLNWETTAQRFADTVCILFLYVPTV